MQKSEVAQFIGVLSDLVADDRVENARLDNFAQAALDLARRESVEKERVAVHALGLVEGAENILYAAVVDGGFAADGTVHLREQGRRNLYEAGAAHVQRGGKSRHVPDDAAAQSHDDGGAVQAGFQHAVQNFKQGVAVLVPLACGNDANAACKFFRDEFLIQAVHIGIGDDEYILSSQKFRGCIQRALAAKYGARAGFCV